MLSSINDGRDLHVPHALRDAHHENHIHDVLRDALVRDRDVRSHDHGHEVLQG